GSDVSASGDQVRPRSLLHVSKIRCCRVRPTACRRPSGWIRIDGWIASTSLPLAAGAGRTTVHVRPPSVERSKWTRQTLGLALLSWPEPAPIVPPESRPGLFLTGPSTPPGSGRRSLQVFPPSRVVAAIPHHSEGLGPTL